MRRTLFICAIWHVGEIYVHFVAWCRKIAASREGLQEKLTQARRFVHGVHGMIYGEMTEITHVICIKETVPRVCVHTDQHHRGSHVISP